MTSKDTYEQISFSIPTSDHSIPACLVLPARHERVPAVVMLHGTASHKDEVGNSYQRLAFLMAAEGIASIRIDFVGHGESAGFDGDFNFDNARSDIRASVKQLKDNPLVDPNRIGIMGWSQGGTHAMLAAAGEPDFRSIVTWACSLWDTSKIASDKIREEAKEKGYGTLELDWGKTIHVGQRWIEDSDQYNKPLSIASNITSPLLAVIGTEDFMTISGVEQILSKCANPRSRMHVIEGGDHIMNALSWDTRVFYQAAQATILWWKETL